MLMNTPPAQSVTQAFRKMVSLRAGEIALVHAGGSLTYGELGRLSDALALRLVDAGAQRGDRIGVAAVQSPETLVALLAILKAGAGYVPLPVHYPAERLRHIATDAGISLLVGRIPALADAGLAGVDAGLGGLSQERVAGKRAGVLVETSGESLAYVMYTSGSTGTPKGVAVPHRAILRLVQGQDFMDLGPDERILQNSPIAFDAATLEIWGALLNGGTLVLPGEGQTSSLRGLGEIVARERITTLWLTAGLFHAMADERPGDFAPLRQLLTGGDVVSPVKVARVMDACPGLRVINGYGPTENTTFTCCHTITRADLASGRPLPIGRSISGTDVHVLDASLRPVAPGLQGELCVSGAGLALGYLGRPDLTAEKFVPAPWDTSVTLYRTGDLVMDPGDGVIRFFGRIDTQVKIRGYRVELGEIETALETHPAVGQAVVAAVVPEGQTDKVLVAYVVPAGADDPAVADLAAHLADRLPDFARPTLFVVLQELPLNNNGKVDRRRLPVPMPQAAATEAGRPEGPTEERLTGIWKDVLGIETVGATTSFFELGGHSLLAVRLFDRIRRDFGADLPIATLFQHPTIRDLGRLLAPSGNADLPVAVAPLAASAQLFDREEAWDPSVIIHPGPEADAGQTLFVVGGVGGNVNNLYGLAKNLGRQRRVIGFQSRGVLGHRAHDTIEEMAAENLRYLRTHQAKGPYLLAGYSGGAITAFEMARQLEAAGETVSGLLVLDTYAPGFARDFVPRIRVTKGERLLSEWQLLQAEGVARLLTRTRQWLQFKLYQGPLRGLLRRYDLSLYRHRVMEENWLAAARRYDGRGRIGAPIALLYTPPKRLLDRIALSEDATLGWGGATQSGPVRTALVAGDHLTMLDDVHVDELARQVDALLKPRGSS